MKNKLTILVLFLSLIQTSFSEPPDSNLNILDDKCIPDIKNGEATPIFSTASSELFTIDKKNPYGPMLGQPAMVKITFKSNISKNAINKFENLSTIVKSHCTLKLKSLDLDVNWPLELPKSKFKKDILNENKDSFEINFSYETQTSIPIDAQYCYIDEVNILGPGKENSTNITCNNANVYGMSEWKDSFFKTFYPIDMSLYNSWKTSDDQTRITAKQLQDQNFFSTIMAIIGIASALIATGGAVANFVQTKEILKSKEPRVIIYPKVYYEKEPELLYLIIENIGGDIACEVEFKVDQIIKDQNGKSLSEYNFMKKIEELGPKTELKSFFKSYYDPDKNDQKKFSVEVSYKNKSGKTYKEFFTIDPQMFLGVQYVSKSETKTDLAGPLNEIKELLKKVVTESGLKVESMNQIKIKDKLESLSRKIDRIKTRLRKTRGDQK